MRIGSDYAFAVNIMGHMNKLNSKLQGKGVFVLDLYHNVKAFIKKLLFLSCQIGNKQFPHLTSLQKITVCDQNLKDCYYSSLLFDLM